VFLPPGLDIKEPATGGVPLLADKASGEAIGQVEIRDDPFEHLGYVQQLVVGDLTRAVVFMRKRRRETGPLRSVRGKAHSDGMRNEQGRVRVSE
jgi:hypothetical protein